MSSTNNYFIFLTFIRKKGNRELITSNPGNISFNKDGNTNNNHVIVSTPYFPTYYPRDFSKEHMISCKTEMCRIHVLFTDFQISKSSTIEVSTHFVSEQLT